MDILMTKNFEDRYLDLLESGFKELKQGLEANTKTTNEVLEQARRTNGQVIQLKKDRDSMRIDIETLQKKAGNKLDLSGININLVMVLSIIVAVIFAALIGVNVTGIFK